MLTAGNNHNFVLRQLRYEKDEAAAAAAAATGSVGTAGAMRVRRDDAVNNVRGPPS